MSEFLILNKDHWTHDLPQATKDKRTDCEKDKFFGVHQRWDIYEVREDGETSTSPLWGPNSCCVRVPEMAFKDARYVMNAWQRKVSVAPDISTGGTWTVDVTVVMESVSGLEDIAYDNQIKLPTFIEIDSDITNGKKFAITPPTLATQKTNVENKIIIVGGSITKSTLIDTVLTIEYVLAGNSNIRVFKLPYPVDVKEGVLEDTRSGMGLLRKIIKRRQHRIEVAAKHTTMSLAQFNSQFKNKLDLTLQEINGP